MNAVREEFGGVDVSRTRALNEVCKGYTTFRENDVLFAKITPCMENGKLAVVPRLEHEWGFGSTEFHVLRAGEAVLPNWIGHFLSQRELRRDAQRSMTGSAGQLRVPATWLTVRTVPLPPIPEQRRIVAKIEELFSDLDAGVAALERVKANLKRYRASVLKAACAGRLVPTEAALARKEKRRYEPADILLLRILKERRQRWEADQLAKMKAKGQVPQDEKWKARYQEPRPPDLGGLAELPEGWAWTRVETVGDVLLGRQRAPQYLTGRWLRPYLRCANVKDDRLDLSDIDEMDFDPVHLAKYKLEAGDILVSEGQSPELVGQSALYRGGIDGLCFQKTLHRFRRVKGGPSPEFAQIVFRSHVKSGLFRRLASITTNIAHLTLEKFESSPFPLPPASEQNRILAEVERRLSVADKVDQTIHAQLTRATRLRESILKRAFEGKLVPQDPKDEPADKLLARIKASRILAGARDAGESAPRKSGKPQPRARRESVPSE